MKITSPLESAAITASEMLLIVVLSQSLSFPFVLFTIGGDKGDLFFSSLCRAFFSEKRGVLVTNLIGAIGSTLSFQRVQNITFEDITRKYRVLGIPTYIFLKEGTEIERSSRIGKRLLRELYDEE